MIRIKVVSERYDKTNHKVEESAVRYYISGIEQEPVFFNTTIRAHWGIENKLHWLLDVSMGEDASRKRKKNSPQNFSVVFKTASTMLKKYNTEKGNPSIKIKRKMGGWSDQHLIAMVGINPS
jgi:predicted transposase YbfD/YdcC